MKLASLVLSVGLVVFCSWDLAAYGAEITVDQNGGSDFLTITEGVDVAAAGDTVLVMPGTYAEMVLLNEAVTLRSSAGSSSTTISGPASNNDALSINVSGATVDGFTLTAGRQGLYLDSGVETITLTDLVLEETGTFHASLPPHLMETVIPQLTLVPHGSGKYDAILLRSGTIEFSQTMPVLPAGFAYYNNSTTITVAGVSGPVLTIPSGTIIKNWISRFEIGTSSLTGGLMADGVIFTSIYDDEGGDTNGNTTSPNPGNWHGLDFNSTARMDSSQVINCELRFGGNGTGTIRVNNSDPVVNNCVFTSNITDFYVSGSPSLGANQTGNTLNQGAGLPIATSLDHLNNLVLGNTIVPRADGKWNGIQIFSSPVENSWTLPVLPHDFVYYLNSAVITVAGASEPVLTIPSGTIIKSWFSRFEIGTSSLTGGLMADGVLFTSIYDDEGGDTNGSSANPNPGNWQRLDFKSTARADSCRITNCELRYGGSGTGVIQVTNSDPVVNNCIFVSNTKAFHVSGSPSLGANQVGNTLTQGGGLPIATSLDHLNNLVFGNTIVPRADGKWNGIQIFSSPVENSWTLPVLPHDFVYYLNSAVITVAGASEPVLTIPSGTIIKSWFSRFEIGTSSLAGGLMADGVLFTSIYDDEGGDTNGNSANPNSGNWQRLDFNSTARADSCRIINCELRYGGSGTGVIQVTNSDPVVNNCIFVSNTTDFHVSGSPSLGANQTGNTLNQGSGLPIATSLNHLNNLVFGNTIVPRGDDRWNGIRIFNSTVESSWTLPVLPHDFVYYLNSAVITVAGASEPVLTIQPGTIIKNWFSRFEIGSSSEPGGLIAEGVLFTSIYDDEGGDTNGSSANPNSGNWQRIDFNPMTLPESRLVGCELRYGGNPAIEVRQASPSFNDCFIHNSSGAGVFTKGEGANPTLRYCTLAENDIGLKSVDDGYARLIRCCITGNETYGIEAEAPVGSHGTFLANDCWWGSADGPSGVGMGNGDAVSANVVFEPWYTTEACLAHPSGVEDGNDVPLSLVVYGAAPNPFNPSTKISFSLPGDMPVNVEIFDLSGKLVKTLLDENLSAGRHEITWHGRNNRGQTVATGLYFYRLQAGGDQVMKKMMLIK